MNVNAIVGIPLERRRAMRDGGGRGSENWPSKVLHEVGPQMEADGLDRRRLHALADLIETLYAAPPPRIRQEVVGSNIHECPAKYVDGRTKCEYFSLRDGGPAGLGKVYFKDSPEPQNVVGYALTGYGLICWGWGSENGMRSVALNGRVNEVSRVLAADPACNREIDWTQGFINAGHVAMALRFFLEGMTPKEAWRKVEHTPWVDQPKERHMGKVEAEPTPEPEPEPASEPTKPVEVVSMHNDPVEIAHDAYLKAVEAVEKAQAALDHAERELIICKLQRGDGLDDIARDHEMGQQ